MQKSLHDFSSDRCSPQDMLLHIDGTNPPSYALSSCWKATKNDLKEHKNTEKPHLVNGQRKLVGIIILFQFSAGKLILSAYSLSHLLFNTLDILKTVSALRTLYLNRTSLVVLCVKSDTQLDTMMPYMMTSSAPSLLNFH